MNTKTQGFEYELGQAVRLPALGVEGIINGRAEYVNGEPSYNVRYGDPAAPGFMWLDGQFIVPILDATEQQIAAEAAEADEDVQ